MSILRQERIVYVCSDGTEFLNFFEAEKYESRARLYELLEREGVGRGGHWDCEMIRDWILEHSTELTEILTPEILP